EEALALYTQILMVRPETAEARFQIGRIHAAANRGDKAAEAFRAALRYRPSEAAIWRALVEVVPAEARADVAAEAARVGVVIGPTDALATIRAVLAAGRYAEAEARAAAAPPSPDTALLHGRALAGQGKWDQALGPLKRAASSAGAQAKSAYGEALWRAGHPALAEPVLRDAETTEAAPVLAQLLADTCRADEAAAVLTTIPEPTRADRLLQMRVLADLRDVDGAAAAAKAAIALGAPRGATRADLAHHLARGGEVAAAEAILTDELRRKPRDPRALTQRGQLRQSDGRLEEAAADLRQAMAVAPKAGEPYRAYMAGVTVTEDDKAFAALEKALRRSDIEPASRWRMEFAMAKALGDLGRHGEIFTHLHRANAQQRAAYPYAFDAAVSGARAALVSYRTYLADRTPEGPEDRVIFVTGLPRSGTTLVETILAAHPEVTAGGELPLMAQALAPTLDLLAQKTAPSPRALAEAGARYVAAARRRTGATAAFTDKAIGTFSRIGPVCLALPNAHIVVLDRDPRDVALSLYRNMFPDGTHRFATDLGDIGRYIRLFDALVTAWQTLMPDRITRVSYEALTVEPEVEIPRLISAVGLPWDAACLSPHKSKRRVDTLSFTQVRAPINRCAVAGWRRFETELAALEPGLATDIGPL
ncbi:MAG: sulfotransferase, partial [Pseudomonadota bacterium]